MINKFLGIATTLVARLRQVVTRSLRLRRLFALVPAIVTAFTVGGFVFDLESEKDNWGTRTWVYVATQDLTSGTPITKGVVKRVEAPLHLVPPDAITTQPSSTLVRSVERGTILLQEHVVNNDTLATVPTGWVVAGVKGVDPVIDLHQGDSVVLMADGQTVCERGMVTSHEADSLSGDLSVAVAVPIECALQMSGVANGINLAVHGER
ncbi:MAG: hypothetical protein EBU84_01695 [Actinobacteria bacterium]|nr:hypothetical protein [Actinomycetota bacterium]